MVSNPSFTLYPNPAAEYVQLKTEMPVLSVQVTDAMGRRVETRHALSPENGNRLDVSAWKPGIYWLHLRTAEGTAVQKLVKE